MHTVMQDGEIRADWVRGHGIDSDQGQVREASGCRFRETLILRVWLVLAQHDHG